MNVACSRMLFYKLCQALIRHQQCLVWYFWPNKNAVFCSLGSKFSGFAAAAPRLLDKMQFLPKAMKNLKRRRKLVKNGNPN